MRAREGRRLSTCECAEFPSDNSGFGSIVVSDPQEMTRCVVQAVVDAGVCAILSKGWSDRGSRGASSHPADSHKGGADGIPYPPEIL